MGVLRRACRRECKITILTHVSGSIYNFKKRGMVGTREMKRELCGEILAHEIEWLQLQSIVFSSECNY